jgi:AcrR family transcriptional regulator
VRSLESEAIRARHGSAETERYVLAAVEELLREGHSFQSLAVGQIATRAHIGRTSFYNHFPDKTSVLVAFSRLVADAAFAISERSISAPDVDLHGLKVMAAEVVAEYRRHAPLMVAVIDAMSYEPRVKAFWQERMAEFVDLLRRRIEEHRGPDATVDNAVVAEVVTWGCLQTVLQHVQHGPEADDARVADALAGCVWLNIAGRVPA